MIYVARWSRESREMVARVELGILLIWIEKLRLRSQSLFEEVEWGRKSNVDSVRSMLSAHSYLYCVYAGIRCQSTNKLALKWDKHEKKTPYPGADWRHV